MEHLTQEQLSLLMSSPETKKLLSILKNQNPELLQQSIQAAKMGNTSAVKQLLEDLLSATDAPLLAKQLEQRLG